MNRARKIFEGKFQARERTFSTQFSIFNSLKPSFYIWPSLMEPGLPFESSASDSA
jgi:hypothetical protein